MKNILNKIEFHYTFLLMAVGFILTGHFINLIIFTSIVVIHELGHYLSAKILKYKVSKIIIYPYGGMTKLDTIINTKIEKDLIVAISGVIMQTIYFLFFYFLFSKGLIREYVYNIFFLYYKGILLFNLLPIVPLDGSKIMNLILSKYINFNMANRLTTYISLVSLAILLISNYYEYNYSLFMTILLLLRGIYIFYGEISYIYSRFLLERYLYHFDYKKKKIIKNKNKMYKNRIHFFTQNNRMINEKQYLNNIFNKKN